MFRDMGKTSGFFILLWLHKQHQQQQQQQQQNQIPSMTYLLFINISKIIVNPIMCFQFFLCILFHKFFLYQTKGPTIEKGNHGNGVN